MNIQQEIFPRHIFRAYDIRGKVTQLGSRTIQAIAHGLAQQFKLCGQRRIVLGYDARLTSPSYAQIIKQVLSSYGFEVTEIGCCSTPQMYFAARSTDGNGIMVTASHNVKEDNGIKWLIQSEPPTPEQIQAVGDQAEQLYYQLGIDYPSANIQHEIKAAYCLSYQNALIQDIQLKRPLKVVLDGMHGSAGRCTDLILQKMGCEVISIRCQANGNFPDHAPDPSRVKNLVLLREKILLHQADIGIALDGDGDRVVILDEHAQVISPDRLMCLFAELCLATHPKHEVVFDVKCSSMVKETIGHLGGQPKMIRTGSTFMRKYLSQSQGKAVFGGEYAGHYVFNDGRGLGYDDGTYAALRIMEYMTLQHECTLSDIFSKYPERYATEDQYIQTYGIEPARVIDCISAQSQSLDAEIHQIDGLRLDFNTGFGIMRPSNTGDFFTIRFDAQCPNELENIRQQFISMLSDQFPKIAHDISNAH